MLYVNVYNKKSLDRSSISTVDYYKKLINKLNLDTGDLSHEFDDLLRTIRELREHLVEDKKQVQDDLNTIRNDTHEAGINADNTLDAIQKIIDQCEEELEDLETEVEAECNQCDYCDYCDYCSYTSPEPICTYDDDCNNVDCNQCEYEEGCVWDITCAYSGEGECTYNVGSCSYDNTMDDCTFSGQCDYAGDCTYDGTCSYIGFCDYTGWCTHEDSCNQCNWSSGGAEPDDVSGCTYNGSCAFTETGGSDPCTFSGHCTYDSAGDSQNCTFTGSCSFDNNGNCSFVDSCGQCKFTNDGGCEYAYNDCSNDCVYYWDDDCGNCSYTCSYDDDGLSCAYSEDCGNDLVCGEASCGECGDYSDCGDGYSCGDYNQD